MRNSLIQLFSLCVLSLCLASCSSGSKVESNEAMGEYVFELLEQINVESLDKTVGLFAKKSDIEQYLKEVAEGDSKYAKLIDEETQESPEYLYTSLNNVKRDAAKYGIEWDKVIYLDFVVPHHLDKKEFRGELFLKFDEKVYSLFADYISIKGKFYLTNLSGIQRVSR